MHLKGNCVQLASGEKCKKCDRELFVRSMAENAILQSRVEASQKIKKFTWLNKKKSFAFRVLDQAPV